VIAIADLESFLGVAAGTDTDLLLALEAAAVKLVENATHRYFGTATAVTEVYPGNNQRDMYLLEPPTAATGVSIIYQGWPGDTTTSLASSDDDGWVLRDQHLTRKGGYVWDRTYEYKITYTRGYALTASAATGTPADIAAPDDIRQVVKMIVARWYGGGTPAEVLGGISSERIGDYSYTLANGNGSQVLSEIPGVDAILSNYHQPYV
jgi:hypothetical protein